ncbi:HAD-superfamily hydrolase [Cunninghamella echinulata]|nr:HAD-superfamily hydrolase [Cunninghamella echinulata]
MAKDPISVISKELSQNNNIKNMPDSIYGLEHFQFDPHFAIRGLHYDYNNGWLMKIDNMANIQLNTVHVGRESIKNPQEVIELHNGLHIPPDYLKNNMFQLSDLFSIPQSCILSDVLQYFKEKDISFHPRYLSDDISQAAKILHTGLTNLGGRLHAAINKDISKYLEPSPKVVSFLENLRKNGKKTFLLTNSTLPFIDIGMTYLTSSPDWRDLFDCVIVSARKPDFYHSRRPFRHTSDKWGSVDSFEPGKIYSGGNVNDFSRLTGWSGQRVLYFGDHIFSDLLDPSVNGWRTGAIIHELAEEINIRNTSSYRHTLAWLLRLEQLLNEAQSYQPENRPLELNNLIQEWRHERSALRLELKVVFNRHFGSVFRTHNNPTYFANKLRKFADIYTSNITNLQNIPGDYVFFPNRTYLPHERVMETLVDTGGLR